LAWAQTRQTNGGDAWQDRRAGVLVVNGPER